MGWDVWDRSLLCTNMPLQLKNTTVKWTLDTPLIMVVQLWEFMLNLVLFFDNYFSATYYLTRNQELTNQEKKNDPEEKTVQDINANSAISNTSLNNDEGLKPT